MKKRTRSEQRAYDQGYADGYRGAHDLLQREIREEYEQRRLSELRRAARLVVSRMRQETP